MVYAWVVEKNNSQPQGSLQTLDLATLPNHDLLLKVHYSSLNYKDALAITNSAPVLRQFPIIPGIDICGEVIESQDSKHQPGTLLIATGWGLGESHWGGFSEMARVKPKWTLPLPSHLTPFQAMQTGTAGLTAMLCIMALERSGLSLEQGEILVMGASGGVGLFAIALLNRLGYRVIASSGKYQILEEKLLKIGASEVIDRIPSSSQPLQKERWEGAIDPVGGDGLSTVLSQMKYNSAIATCGLAGGANFNSSVYPFILRGVSLLGVDSVYASRELRIEAWQRISSLLDQEFWAALPSSVISLSDLPQASQNLLAGKSWGRTVVDCQQH